MKKITAALFLVVSLTLAAPLPASAVDAPKWVAAIHIAAQKAVGLRWNPVAGATGYKILRSTTAGSGHVEIATTPSPQYFDKDVQPGEQYYYVLQTVAGAEVSPSSGEKMVAIPGEKKKKVLLAPELSKLTLTQTTEFGKTSSKVGIVWTPPRGGKAIAYNLFRSETPGSGHAMITSTSETQFIDTGVEVGKTYYYLLTALDETFTETPKSAEKSILVTEPKKKKVKKRQEKIKIKLRRTTKLGEIKEGDWGKIQQPGSLAVNSDGEVFIYDSLQVKVFVFGPPPGLEFLFLFGEKGNKEGQFNRPQSMCLTPDDELYFAGSYPWIDVFNTKGSFKRRIPLEEIMSEVETEKDIGAGTISCGEDAYILSGNRNHTVYVLSYDNELITRVGKMGKEPGQFMNPTGAYIDPATGELVVADMYNFRVQRFKDGEPVGHFGSYGNSAGQFARLMDTLPDDLGNILTADFMNNTIQAFKPDGTFAYVLGTEDLVNQIGLTTPVDMEFNGKDLYVANKLGKMVNIFRLEDEIEPPVKGKKKKKKKK